MTYDALTSLVALRKCPARTAILGAQLLIMDEGHQLKSPKLQAFKAVQKMSTNNKLLLSGTPIQNNLMECKFENLRDN